MLAITGAGGYWLGHSAKYNSDTDLFSQKPVNLITEQETMSVAAAQLQREEHYQNLNTIPEVLSLPSLFSQQEALHVVNSRCSSSSRYPAA